MYAFKQLVPSDLELKEASTTLAKLVAACHLESLEFENMPLASGMADGWFAGLAHNTSIRELFLPGCSIPLPSTVVLMASLLKNKTLHTLVVPTDYKQYWLGTVTGYVFGLMVPRQQPGVTQSKPFGFRTVGNVNRRQHAEANMTLDAVQEAGEAFFKANRTRFVENRRHMLGKNVVLDMEVFITNFLASALAANAPYKQKDLLGAFVPGAGAVLQHLAKEQNLHAALQLPLLNKTGQAYQNALTPEEASSLRMELETRLDLDKDLNAPLKSAVLSRNVDELRKHLQEGEIDFGGKVRALAAKDAPEMVVVFDELAPKTEKFIALAPTTTTTTTATTTTTTTTSTTDAPVTTITPSSVATPTTATTTNTFAPSTTSGVTHSYGSLGFTPTQMDALTQLLRPLPRAEADSDEETSLD